MTTTIETTIEEATQTNDALTYEPTVEYSPPPPRRAPTLAELLREAEAAEPDPLAIARAELDEIVGRADHPQPGDGQRLLELAGNLQISREAVRAVVESVIVWRRQAEESRAAMANSEVRQAELSAQIEDLEAKRGALELDRGYEALHALAVAGVAHMLKTRAPNLMGGFLNYAGWTSDQFGFEKGNHRAHPMLQAARRQWMDLLGTDVARQIVADLARRNVARGGVASGCSTEQLHENDL